MTIQPDSVKGGEKEAPGPEQSNSERFELRCSPLILNRASKLVDLFPGEYASMSHVFRAGVNRIWKQRVIDLEIPEIPDPDIVEAPRISEKDKEVYKNAPEKFKVSLLSKIFGRRDAQNSPPSEDIKALQDPIKPKKEKKPKTERERGIWQD